MGSRVRTRACGPLTHALPEITATTLRLPRPSQDRQRQEVGQYNLINCPEII